MDFNELKCSACHIGAPTVTDEESSILIKEQQQSLYGRFTLPLLL